MNQKEFEAMFEETMKSIHHLLVVKGGEYAGSEDRLGNFKRGAERVQGTPMQVLWIYAAKHIDSIETFIKDGVTRTNRPRSEPIEGRIDDLINYCILLKGLVWEAKNLQREPTMAEVKAKADYEAHRNANQTTVAGRDDRVPEHRISFGDGDGSYPVPTPGPQGFRS
jgi:hypothetical protein